MYVCQINSRIQRWSLILFKWERVKTQMQFGDIIFFFVIEIYILMHTLCWPVGDNYCNGYGLWINKITPRCFNDV